jgi:hypothetical protein
MIEKGNSCQSLVASLWIGGMGRLVAQGHEMAQQVID